MKRTQVFLLLAVAILALAVLKGKAKSAPAADPQTQPSQPANIASTVDREISGIEKQIVEIAEAMPEDKYNFSPEGLTIPGADYKGVRSFALQLKHVAASNWYIWSPLTGDKLPEGQ
jgi:hypothetical protein